MAELTTEGRQPRRALEKLLFTTLASKMQYASFSASQLSSWALLNNVELRGVRVQSDILSEDGISKGGGLVATSEHGEGESLLIVPQDVIISKEQINACARTDVKLRELLATLADSDFINVGSTHL